MRIALVSSKGGAGKSTTATAVACELHRRGRKVLVVDLDPQGTCLDWRRCREVSEGPAVISMAAGFAGELERLAAGYDDVVFDTPGRDDRVAREAILVADVAIVCSQPTPADLWAVADTVDTVRRACGLRPDLKAAVLLTRLDARLSYARAAGELLATMGLPLLPTSLGQRAAFQHAMAAGIGPTILDPDSKASGETIALVDALETMTHEQVSPTNFASA